MEQVVPVALLGALVYAIINFLKALTNRQWNAVVTQATVWIAGLAVVWLGAHTSFAGQIVFAGTSLAAANAGDLVLFGLSAASLFSFGNDFKKAIDGTDSAKTPPLLPSSDQ